MTLTNQHKHEQNNLWVAFRARNSSKSLKPTNQSVGAMHSVAVGRACHSSTRHRGRQAHKISKIENQWKSRMSARGRPKGIPKSGGRKPGTPNKTNAARVAAIEASGLTPLDYMLEVLRDPDAAKERRAWAAVSAAPYVHPRLTSIGGTPDQPVELVITWAGAK